MNEIKTTPAFVSARPIGVSEIDLWIANPPAYRAGESAAG
jgi:hypothetical protein